MAGTYTPSDNHQMFMPTVSMPVFISNCSTNISKHIRLLEAISMRVSGMNNEFQFVLWGPSHKRHIYLGEGVWRHMYHSFRPIIPFLHSINHFQYQKFTLLGGGGFCEEENSSSPGGTHNADLLVTHRVFNRYVVRNRYFSRYNLGCCLWRCTSLCL